MYYTAKTKTRQPKGLFRHTDPFDAFDTGLGQFLGCLASCGTSFCGSELCYGESVAVALAHRTYMGEEDQDKGCGIHY
jgi:hypothetical protein